MQDSCSKMSGAKRGEHIYSIVFPGSDHHPFTEPLLVRRAHSFAVLPVVRCCSTSIAVMRLCEVMRHNCWCDCLCHGPYCGDHRGGVCIRPVGHSTGACPSGSAPSPGPRGRRAARCPGSSKRCRSLGGRDPVTGRNQIDASGSLLIEKNGNRSD